jgi:hypothetical protein
MSFAIFVSDARPGLPLREWGQHGASGNDAAAPKNQKRRASNPERRKKIMTKTMKTLSVEADVTQSPDWVLREALPEALAAEYPAAAEAASAARALGCGKKEIVARAAAAILDLHDPEIVEALRRIATSRSARAAAAAAARLGFAGELLTRPQQRGLRLPCAPHACPGWWGTNWGLPNTQAAAERVLRLAPAMPTAGNGWKLVSA